MSFFSRPTLLKGSWSSAGFGCEGYRAEKGRGGEGEEKGEEKGGQDGHRCLDENALLGDAAR